MKRYRDIVWVLAASMLVAQVEPVQAKGAGPSEYELKAAYIYKIMQFVRLPAKARADDAPRKPRIVVGVTDKGHIKEIQDTVEGKEIRYANGKTYTIVVQYVTSAQVQAADSLEELDVLFVCGRVMNADLSPLLKTAMEHKVMAFGDRDGFLETGGTVNFVVKKNKLRFEINTGTAAQAGIKMRSQLLKLAVKVIHKQMNFRGTTG